MFERKTGNKRNPIADRPLPRAGDSLRRALVESLVRGSTWAVVAAAVCLQAALEWYRWYFGLPPFPFLYTAIAAATVIIAVFMWRKSIIEADRLGLGREGELSVGQTLDRLRADGFQIFHDLAEGSFNIDHIIIGPPGVFVIETKTISLIEGRENRVRFDGQKVWVNGQLPDRDPIAQVLANSRYVAELLKRMTGRPVSVRSVVLYPGWFVEPQPKGADVWVLNPKVLAAFLRHEPRRLGTADISLFSSALETYQRANAAAASF